MSSERNASGAFAILCPYMPNSLILSTDTQSIYNSIRFPLSYQQTRNRSWPKYRNYGIYNRYALKSIFIDYNRSCSMLHTQLFLWPQL